MKVVLLCALLLLIAGSYMILKTSPFDIYKRECDCSERKTTPAVPESSSSPRSRLLLSYQPPGNGWNNQRIALENAFVLAKLLNRTLVVHPLSPHKLGSKLKAGRIAGYMAYNKLNSSDLLPLSNFIDLELMSQVIPVQEVAVSHPQFVSDYSHLTWKNICHSPGYGFWVDQLPKNSAQVELLSKQHFISLGHVWRSKCAEERIKVEKNPSSLPLIKYVEDLQNEPSEMLYFEQGTLFGIHIRFTTMERALEAQRWVVNHVRYNQAIWGTVAKVGQTIGPLFNAIQVRRTNHMDKHLTPFYWIERMVAKKFSKKVPVYVATDDASREWFKPFFSEGYDLHFSTDFPQYLNFPSVKETLRNDLLGVHEQCLCERATKFVGSPASTFISFIQRHRGEVKMKGEFMMSSLHTYWIGHQIQIDHA